MNPLSGVLSESWTLYKTYAQHLLTIAFVVYVVAALLELLFVGLLGNFGLALAGLVGIIALFLLQTAIVKAVEDVRDGRADLSLGDTLRAAQPFLGRVAVASILGGIAIAIGLIFFIAPGLYLLTIWCLIVPVIVLEAASIGGAFTRSRELVRGYGWHVLGTIVVVWLVLLAVGLVIGLVLSPLPDGVARALGDLVSGTLVSPFLAVVVTLAYFRLLAAKATGNMPPTGAAPPVV